MLRVIPTSKIPSRAARPLESLLFSLCFDITTGYLSCTGQWTLLSKGVIHQQLLDNLSWWPTWASGIHLIHKPQISHSDPWHVNWPKKSSRFTLKPLSPQNTRSYCWVLVLTAFLKSSLTVLSLTADFDYSHTAHPVQLETEFVPSLFICWSLNPQCDCIWVCNLKGGNKSNRTDTFMRRRKYTRSLCTQKKTPVEDNMKTAVLQAHKRGLTCRQTMLTPWSWTCTLQYMRK